MKQRLFIFLGLLGVAPLVLTVPRKFYLIQQSATWSGAQTYCRANHTDLATIETAAEMLLLQMEAQKQPTSIGWIGLYNDLLNWRWSLDNEPLGSMRLFPSGVPDNAHGNEECVFTTSGGWWDVPCDTVIAFICYDAKYTNVTEKYIHYSSGKNWDGAQQYCRQYHTDLASSRTPAEHSIVGGLTSWWTWFGLFKDPWRWSDRSNFTFSSWMPDRKRYMDCVYYNQTQAAGAPCTDKKPFFCYRVITGQQRIIRIKIRWNQDVNDPAVNTVILQKILLQLNQRGVENIALKFRPQTDGTLFNKLPASAPPARSQ